MLNMENKWLKATNLTVYDRENSPEIKQCPKPAGGWGWLDTVQNPSI